MGVFGISTPLCLSNMSSVKQTTSLTLGVISVIAWVFAEVPQIITNYRDKTTEGLSVAFLATWVIGDLFNLFGCLLEPATLPTQLYTAVLYTIITVSLVSQTVYYGHIYPRLKYKRQLKVETPTKAGQSNGGNENANDAGWSNGFDDSNTGTGLSSPIPLPAHPQNISIGRELYFQSARYLSKSHISPAGSILAERMMSNSPHLLDSIEEPLLGSGAATQSAPVSKIKPALCLVSTFTFLGVFNLLQSSDTKINSMVSKRRQEFVIYVGRKLFQVSGNQMPEDGTVASSAIGTLLGWAMAIIYMGGRLPQICLNIRRGNFEGLNPLMFVFALIGNVTYVASILVSSLDWSSIRRNLPWLVDAGGCALLDSVIFMQFIYFSYWKCQGLKSKYKPQSVA